MKNKTNWDGGEDLYLASEETREAAEETAAAQDAPGGEAGAASENKKAPGKPVRVHEIPERRGENRRVFRMSDGTEQAVYSPGRLHVLNRETQVYDNVDTSMTLNEEGSAYVNDKNGFTACFSRNEENEELYSITDGTHRVTVLAQRNDRQRRGRACAARLTRKQNEARADALLFEEVMPGADYAYSVTGSGVKEEIVIKERAEVYRYPFLLHCENTAVRFDEAGGRAAFVDPETGREVFYIPAPFMKDAAGAVSPKVSYDFQKLENGDGLMTVTADRDWMEAEERVFPVIVDPQIRVSGVGALTTYSWTAGDMYSAPLHTIGSTVLEDGTCQRNRMYVELNMPDIPGHPHIRKAELQLCQASGSASGSNSKFGLYPVLGSIEAGVCTPSVSSELLDYEMIRTEEDTVYTFDITKLTDALNKGESACTGLVVRMLDESSCQDQLVLYGSADSDNAPQLVITYESGYTFNSGRRAHTHELGRFGQGSIDLTSGTLTFAAEDFSWAGGRMPVTLKHLYSSALAEHQYTENAAIGLKTADFSAMRLGYGFKLNVMQSMKAASFQHEGTAYDGYVFIGENGDETYFKVSEKNGVCPDSTQCYPLYEDVDGAEMLYDPCQRILTTGGDTLRFDEAGRLIRITDEKENRQSIFYNGGRITAVTDGAGRSFGLGYDGEGYLTSITAPDGTNILYSYTDGHLSQVIYPNGRKAEFSYSDHLPAAVVLSDGETAVYKVVYTFSGGRVASAAEYGIQNGALTAGASTSYSYSAAARRTVTETTEPRDGDAGETEDTVIKTVYTFDDDGALLSEYMYSEENGGVGVSGGGSGIHPYAGEGTGLISNHINLLADHSFESLTGWTTLPCSCGDFTVSSISSAKYGSKACRLSSCEDATAESGIEQVSSVLPAGDYAFSAYIRVISEFRDGSHPGAFLRVTDTAGNVLGESERLWARDGEYLRLVAPFTLSTDRSVRTQIVLSGRGEADVDAAQLENNPFAGEYNLLENGSFERGSEGWDTVSGVFASTGASFSGSQSLFMSGGLDSTLYASQKAAVKTDRSIRETFTLSGWAKGYGLVNRERENAPAPQFRLRAEVKYCDAQYNEYGTETYTADFSPCTEEWQLASVQFAKEKYRTLESITVYCDYSNNFGSAFFDNIQLVRDSIETGLGASDFVVESTGADEAGADEEETAADTAPAFEELRDAFGNALTETTFTDGEFGTIYRSFGYNTDNSLLSGNDAGNNLVRETDARGSDTLYTVDSETSRNEEITDRCGNKTAYEYDDSGRTTKVTSKKADDTEMANVSYAYDAFDNLTEIARGDGMKYALAYNAFHSLESIGVDGKADKLATYAYKNGSGRLKQVTYANGDTMKVSYNAAGQLTAERWYDKDNTLTAHYQYAYDGQGNIVRSVDMLAQVEYNYIYEQNQLVRATESSLTLNGGIITARNFENTIFYSYDSEGKLTRKRIHPAAGADQIVYYENPENEGAVVKFTAGGRTVTSHSKTDSFGRKVFDELQLSTGFVSRQFSYHAGEVTEEHLEGGKLKSSPTTQLVSQIVLSGGRAISYDYDAEERITRVTDSVDGVTEYTYDALGQLLTETVNGTVVNTMTYDNYGNIAAKNGIAYTYGDSAWKDLLTKVGDQTITYDAQGNPTSYLGHTLTWEKGRQLKSFDSSTYTYNANGIRTSKTVDGVKHTYTLEGAKILRETWGSNKLLPIYDNEDTVCGIIYNNEPYYFQKNLQGDIIGITDKNGEVTARYHYDAWGVCTVVQDSSDCGIAEVNPYRYRGYYYDAETGLYYLQSRYYDASVGRFVNEDEATYSIAFENVLYANPFIYCENNAANKTDYTGCSSLRPVGVGLQVELNISWRAYGIELVWYFEASVRKGRAFYIPYAYLYGGPGLSGDITTIISKIMKNPSLIFTPKSLTKASASICVFAIFGYSNFINPSSYEGAFTGVSVTAWHVKSYTSWGDSCFVIGVGASTSKFSASTGVTYYKLSSAIFNGLSKLYNLVAKEGKTLQ